MNRPRHRQNPLVRRGFTLIEIMVVLTLLATFSLLACAFFNTLLKTDHVQAQVQAQMMGAEAALGKLRREVWECDKVEVIDGHHLVVTREPKQRVTWVLDGEGLSRQEEGAAVMTWHWDAAAWEFSAVGAGVKVVDTQSGSGRLFVAELRRLEGGKP